MIYRLKAWIGKHAPWHAIYSHRELDELRENAVSYEQAKRFRIEAALRRGFPEHFGGGELINAASLDKLAQDYDNLWASSGKPRPKVAEAIDG